MFHLNRFAAGVLTGIAATYLYKNRKTKASLEEAEDTLRGAAVSTLEAVEKASAKARSHLADDETADAKSPEKKTASRRRVTKPSAGQGKVTDSSE
jgi:hypothetical protein